MQPCGGIQKKHTVCTKTYNVLIHLFEDLEQVQPICGGKNSALRGWGW